jgi:flagellar biosynthesis/type III secretory pathway chaperone
MLRNHLQSLMEQKSTQLQTLGTMGQEILKQQQELEERIRSFEEEEQDDHVGEGTKTKLRDLDDAMRMWESQNEDMMRELGGKVSLLWSRTGVED